MRGRELQFRSSRSSVRLDSPTKSNTAQSTHLNISVLRDDCAPSWPPSPPPGLHVWRDRQCFRHAARPMRQTANVIVAASHPQITERLHPPFWPRLQLDTTLLRPCFEGAARCRGAHAPMAHAAVLHLAGYQPQGTAYIDKRLDARTLVLSLPPASLSFPRDLECRHLLSTQLASCAVCPPTHPRWSLFRQLPALVLLTPPSLSLVLTVLGHSSLTVATLASPCSCSPTGLSLHLHQAATPRWRLETCFPTISSKQATVESPLRRRNATLVPCGLILALSFS